jgi:hypothetical protein
MILSERYNEANDLSEIALSDKKKHASHLAAWLPFLLRIIWIGLSPTVSGPGVFDPVGREIEREYQQIQLFGLSTGLMS